MARTLKSISRVGVATTNLSATGQISDDNELPQVEQVLADTANIIRFDVYLVNGGAAQNAFQPIAGTYSFTVNIVGYASTTNATVEVVLDGTSTFDIDHVSAFRGGTSLTLQSNHGSPVIAQITAIKQ